MIAPMPCCCMSARALARRCSRSWLEIGGGIGIVGSSAAACANTRPSGRVIAAANAPPPISKVRRSTRACIMNCPRLKPNVARLRPIGQQARPMFDSLAHDGVKRPGTREMTFMLAGLMALNAFAIDSMIPALADIGRSLHVAHENDQQLVIIAYFLGFASTQLLWGPLADRYGRKPVLGVGVVLYGAFALLCATAASFPLLISERVAMGASAAVTRVLVVAMVRDLFEAEAMARVMSLVFMTFMLVPVLAPNIGQLILLFAPWRAIFIVIALYAAAMLSWSWLRLPETLHPEFRRSLEWRGTFGAIAETLPEPQSRGYRLATVVSYSGLVAYISSIQQIVFDAFHAGRYIGLVF